MELKSKEEILDKYAIGCTAGQYDIETGKAEAALSEYAQQVAISFAEWKVRNNYQGVDTNDEGIIWNIPGSPNCQTSAELYTLFLTHK
jgi:hypothetical protein